ncbi:unnamed protein product [Adineta steineri]|uniref:Tyrosine-protein phosphatase domain-containing protein n=1 Tax=Adineta steineri TaxID=433720 RepID=A0A814LSI7_9BILA|nr:unnamed protein product [Adineta steineri]
MLKKINEQESINIPSFLKHIRQQRNFLVQTEEQFIFIYDVLLEAVHLANIDCNDLELNEQNFQSIIQMLNYYDKTLNLTRIEKQFQLIIEKSNNNNQLIIGQMKENLAKNRTQAILPLDSCRVLLSTDKKPKDGGYINASYIHETITDWSFHDCVYPAESIVLSTTELTSLTAFFFQYEPENPSTEQVNDHKMVLLCNVDLCNSMETRNRGKLILDRYNEAAFSIFKSNTTTTTMTSLSSTTSPTNLQPWQIVFIVIGAMLVFILCLLCLINIYKRRK